MAARRGGGRAGGRAAMGSLPYLFPRRGAHPCAGEAGPGRGFSRGCGRGIISLPAASVCVYAGAALRIRMDSNRIQIKSNLNVTFYHI